jgi:RNA polymerase sigma factor (sigma-70 family)
MPAGPSDELAVADRVAARDMDQLFSALAPRLERIVRVGVRASDALIEDACQSAWARLIDHADGVRGECALSWLATTAYREAFKLAARQRREESLEELAEVAGCSAELVDRRIGPHELAECRERIATIGTLPSRQHRFVWMHAAGFSYAEIALGTGHTRRTVERQLLRGRARALALTAE